MKKIDYSKIRDKDEFKKAYLAKLGLFKDGTKPTDLYNSMNTEWENILKQYNNLNIVFKLIPKNVKDIITANYEDISNYQEEFREIILDNDIQKNACDSINNIKQIFNYNISAENLKINRFDTKIRNFFIENSEKLNINTCHYCDIAYTGTFEKSNGDEKGQFELDHFFSKEKYPFLALSLYNFIPSCHWCNSYKHSTDWNIGENGISKEISPASDKYNFDDNVKIRVEPKLIDEHKGLCYGDNFAKNPNLYKVVFNFNENSGYDTLNKILHLEERYNMISIKSVALHLLDLKKKYPPQHINEISEIFINNNIRISEDEIRKFIFNGNQDKKYSLLNKLRKDILDW